MMDKPWKVVLVLVGMFAAGMVTGGFVAARLIKHIAQKRVMPEQWGPARLKMLAERLELSPEQVETLRPIMRRDAEDMNRIRSYSFNETKHILERMEHDISAVLTPGQKEKFDRMNKEFRERAERFMRERGMRGPGGGLRDRPPRGDRPPPPVPTEEPKDKPAGKPAGGG